MRCGHTQLRIPEFGTTSCRCKEVITGKGGKGGERGKEGKGGKKG